MANVLFKKGLVQNLANVTGQEGTFYLAEDERSLYFGKSGGAIERIQGSVLVFNSLAEFTSGTKPPYSTDVIYFIANENALVRWDGSKWVQLNALADTVVSIQNSLTALSETVADNVTNIATNATNIATNAAAIEQNKTDIATKAAQSDLTALEGRVTDAEADLLLKATKTELAATNEAVAANTAKLGEHDTAIAANTKLINDYKTANDARVKDAEDDIADLNTKKADKTTVEALTTRVTSAEETIGDHGELLKTQDAAIKANTKLINDYKTANDARVKDAEDDIADLNTNKADKSTVTALTTRVSNAEETIGTHSTNIGTLQNQMALKAEQEDLESLEGRVGTVEGKVSTLEGQVTDLSTNKANQSDLDSLEETVGDISDDLDQAERDITGLNNTKLDKTTFNDYEEQMTGTINGLDGRIDVLERTDVSYNSRIETVEEGVGALEANKLDASIYNNFISDKTKDTGYAYMLEKVKGIEEGANRTIVDDAFSTTSTNPVQNKVVTDKVNSLTTQHNALAEQVGEIANSLGLESSGGTTLTGRVVALEQTMPTKADKTYVDEKDAALGKRIDDTNAIVTQHTNTLNTITESTIPTLATKTELNTAKTDLTDLINDKIDAANAMSYKNGVAKAEDLPESGVAIGDTYVVTAGFTLNGVALNPGDLVVASGDETDGIITSNLSWTTVSTGYSRTFDQTLSLDEGTNSATVNLHSYAGAVSSAIVLKSVNECLTVEVADDSESTVEFNMVWGSF